MALITITNEEGDILLSEDVGPQDVNEGSRNAQELWEAIVDAVLKDAD